MSKSRKWLTVDQWIEALNEANSSEIIAYSNELFVDIADNAFKNLVYRNTFNKLSNIILRMFKWKIPETFSERAMELGLLNTGWLCCFHDTNGFTGCLPGRPSNVWNVNGEPTQFSVSGFNGYHQFINVIQDFDSPQPMNPVYLTPTENEGVVMRDNYMSYPYINYIREYAHKLADKIIGLHIATQRLKCPFEYVVREEELKDTVEELVKKKRRNEDTIIRVKKGNNGRSLDDTVQLVQNNMRPEIIQAMKDAILFDFNMFLETIGVNTNPTPDKTQYVNDQELGSNNSLIDLSRDVRFLNRKKFCKDAKKLGIKMSVEVNVDELQDNINKFKKEIEGEKDDTNNANNSQ